MAGVGAWYMLMAMAIAVVATSAYPFPYFSSFRSSPSLYDEHNSHYNYYDPSLVTSPSSSSSTSSPSSPLNSSPASSSPSSSSSSSSQTPTFSSPSSSSTPSAPSSPFSSSTPTPSNSAPATTTPSAVPSGNTNNNSQLPQTVVSGQKVWCIAKPGSDEMSLMQNIVYACGEGAVDCSTIQPSGACYQPNTLVSHASYVMNMFYQKNQRNWWTCHFNATGLVVFADPSFGSCIYSPQ